MSDQLFLLLVPLPELESGSDHYQWTVIPIYYRGMKVCLALLLTLTSSQISSSNRALYHTDLRLEIIILLEANQVDMDNYYT